MEDYSIQVKDPNEVPINGNEKTKSHKSFHSMLI